jgi:hypothetical protein
MRNAKPKIADSEPPTVTLMTGRCSCCSAGRQSLQEPIACIEHVDAPRVPAVGLEGHPNNCQCKHCRRLAAKNGTVAQWFGFCRRCAAVVGGVKFPEEP